MSAHEIKITVCVLAYNHGPYIREAVTSVLNQETNFPIEVLVGEDCSTDNTATILEELKAEYPNRFSVIYQDPANKIYIDKRPTGRYNLFDLMKRARGKYIALLDGDDYWTDPLKLQKQADFLDTNPECVVSGHDRMVFYEKDKTFGGSFLKDDFKRDASSTALKMYFLIPIQSIMFRNNPFLLDEMYKYNMHSASNGDVCLISVLGNLGTYHYHDDIKPSVYRVHQGGVWSLKSPKTRILMHQKTFQILYEYYIKKNDEEVARHFKKMLENTKLELKKITHPIYVIKSTIIKYLPNSLLSIIKRIKRNL